MPGSIPELTDDLAVAARDVGRWDCAVQSLETQSKNADADKLPSISMLLGIARGEKEKAESYEREVRRILSITIDMAIGFARLGG